MLPLPSSGQCHYTVAFSPDGRWLAAGGSDYAVDVWDLHAPQSPARRFPGGAEPIVRAQFGPAGLVVVGMNEVRVINVTTPAHSAPKPISASHVTRAAVSAGAESVVLVCNDGLSAWSFRPLLTCDWNRGDRRQGNISDVAVTENGRLLVVGSDLLAPHGEIEIRNLGTGLVIDTIRVTGRPHRVACSADGARAAVVAHGQLSVWDLPARRRIVERTAEGHGGWLSVAFDPRGRRIVTGGIDSTVAVWDAASTGAPLTTFQWGVGPVYAVAFDRDGLRAAAAGHSGAIVWDADE